jgi:hypothetical protein
MIHKGLLFLVSLVISDFSNHKAVNRRREMRRDYHPKFENPKSRNFMFSKTVIILDQIGTI